MSYDEDAKDAARAMLELQGEPATYTPPGGGSPVSLFVLVERDRRYVPDLREPVYSQISTIVTVLAEDLPSPQRGGTIAVGSASYKVQRPLDSESASYMTELLVTG